MFNPLTPYSTATSCGVGEQGEKKKTPSAPRTTEARMNEWGRASMWNHGGREKVRASERVRCVNTVRQDEWDFPWLLFQRVARHRCGMNRRVRKEWMRMRLRVRGGGGRGYRMEGDGLLGDGGQKSRMLQQAVEKWPRCAECVSRPGVFCSATSRTRKTEECKWKHLPPWTHANLNWKAHFSGFHCNKVGKKESGEVLLLARLYNWHSFITC